MDFKEECRKLGYPLSENQLLQFENYYEFLIQKNEVMNLTRITERDDVYLKHFLDSLNLLKAGPLEHKTLLDVGSGAGFPSIPLKILIPSLEVTIIDALGKRIHFLEELVARLHLDKVTLVHGRAEEFKHRETYDIVTARAMASMNILTELCLPFVKVGGSFIAMKTSHYQEELSGAKHAIEILGGRLKEVVDYSLSEEITYSLIVIEKEKPSDIKYPRNFGLIKKKPL